MEYLITSIVFAHISSSRHSKYRILEIIGSLDGTYTFYGSLYVGLIGMIAICIEYACKEDKTLFAFSRTYVSTNNVFVRIRLFNKRRY